MLQHKLKFGICCVSSGVADSTVTALPAAAVDSHFSTTAEQRRASYLTCCVGYGIVHRGVIAVQAAPAVAVDRHSLPHPFEVGSTVVDARNGI